MKILAGLVLLLLPAPQQQPAATTTYRDPALNFTFTYPAAFVDSGAGGGAQVGGPRTVTSCLSTPLFGVRPAGGEQEELLMLTRVDVGCMGETPSHGFLVTTATRALEQGLKSAGTPVMLAPVDYKLEGHDAIFLEGSTPATKDNDALYGGIACVVIERVVFCSAAVTAFPGHLAELFATPLAFAGRPGVAMVPADKVVRPAGAGPRAQP